ncbi:sigma-54-dependent Fis family transcriptional regulator [Kordiimonas sediminis]|uniref:Sigma-54-dependent Fis family transcriptional regulator n=1 Tax=Kordiimonas sediminis TaxID=1735581 RepID=A0A919ATM7_9PROT|nr:sigma-54 dependent transcriptional regulator [Kordiimonas sediminis]GHF22579.1 sigma-54-dependent Fis family transcriptional regulator [Kordiimonas sediminis]
MRLLIVGTLEGQLGTASKMAMERGASVTHVADIDGALAALRSKGADLLMVEVMLDIPKMIPKLRAEHFSIPVIACGIGTDPKIAAAAIRGGAKEYIPLPPDAELIAAVLEAVSEDNQEFIFNDPVMKQTAALAEQVAPSEASIMITGESGTGKEVMSRFLHSKSKRANKAFVAVNCAAIPENLLESELFGHEKGAFTGAVARRIGKFEEADGGTLLLDEISEMDVRLQAKLLRAIQERKIDRVGGTKPVDVDIRIIATSNRNLEKEVKEGNFREDLFFRLNVVNLRVPPLRERPGDIKALAEFFAEKYADVNKIKARKLSPEAIRILTAHTWPGNVRELENALHRAVLLASGDEIGPEAIMLPDGSGNLATGGALPAATPSAASSEPHAGDNGSVSDAAGAATQNAGGATMVGRTVAEVERDLIIDTLKHCLGNRTHAANILGISIRTLRNKLNQYQSDGVSVPQPGSDGGSSASL